MWNLILLLVTLGSWSASARNSVYPLIQKVAQEKTKENRLKVLEKGLKETNERKQSLFSEFEKTKDQKKFDQAMDLTYEIVALKKVVELYGGDYSCGEYEFIFTYYFDRKKQKLEHPMLLDSLELLKTLCK